VTALGDEADPWLLVYQRGDTFLARWPGKLDVLVPEGGTRLLVHQFTEFEDSVPRLLLCHALSFALASHGREGLHASAVEVDGRAIILAGDTGRGKSTLATALCGAGARLLADDLTIVRLGDEGEPLTMPGSTKTWLVRDVAASLAGRAIEEGTRPHKVRVGAVDYAKEEAPVGAMYLLAFGEGEPQIGEPLPATDAVVNVFGALFNMRVTSAERRAVQFRVATEIAARVPVRRIQWQPDADAARTLAARIITDLRRDRGKDMEVNGSNGTGDARGESRRAIISALRDAGVTEMLDDGLDEPLLRTSQVASLLRSSDRTVRAWADAGKLKYIKTLGGRRLFPASAVLSALRSMSSESKNKEESSDG